MFYFHEQSSQGDDYKKVFLSMTDMNCLSISSSFLTYVLFLLCIAIAVNIKVHFEQE